MTCPRAVATSAVREASNRQQLVRAVRVAAAWAIARFEFPGRGLLVTFIGIFFRGPGYSIVIPYLPFFENSTQGLHFSL